MKMVKFFKIYIVFLFLTFFTYSYAQVGNPSIYSGYGLGRINSGGTVKNEALGGSGVSLGSRTFINTLNPASLSYIDSLEMHIDVGVGGGYTIYKTSSDKGSSFYGGLGNIALAMRASRWSGISFGFDQFSYVGYNISQNIYINGSTDELVNETLEGDGGINEVFASYGFKVGKHLSLGVKGSFLFGTIEKTETYSGSNIGGSLVVDYTDYLYKFKYLAGLQYKFKIKDYRFGIGATYSPYMSFTTDRDVLASASSGAGISEELDDELYEIPDSYVAGLNFATPKGLSFMLDCKYEPWSEVYYADSKTSLQDSYRMSLGSEYYNVKSERIMPFVWNFGAYFEQTNLQVINKSIMDRGVSAGIGIPLKPKNAYDGRGFVNVLLNVGQRGTLGYDIITETYFNLKVSVSLTEIWFMKRRLE